MNENRQPVVSAARRIAGGAIAAARESCLLVAAVATIGAFCWQAAYVEIRHEGNWTVLFLAGGLFGVPPALDGENVFQIPGEVGYDGQFYHLVTHDPGLSAETRKHLDSPRLRWRRILVPVLANTLAFGQDQWIDPAYIAVILSSVFLGTFWLAGHAVLHGLPAWYGLSFLLVPAVAVSIERMTVDAVLACLAVAFWRYTERGPRWAVYVILSLAPLVRETGIALPMAAVAISLYRREWKRAAAETATSLPFLCWAAYVQVSTAADITDAWGTRIPLWGILSRTYRLFFGYPPRGDVYQGIFLDGLAVLGIWIALLLAYRVIRQTPVTIPNASIAIFGLFAVFLGSRSVWYDGIAFARVLSPLIVWLAMYGMSIRSWPMAAPLLLTFPRAADEIFQRTVETIQALR